MKKIIFGIFAHPDDEAFGPSGTLISEVSRGTQVQLITLTLGEAGLNPDEHPDLPDLRESEWREAGSLIGASKLHHLGYRDGGLTNISMVEIGYKLVELINAETESLDDDVEIELMTTDLNGVTGHIDHIVAARATCWAYYTIKARDRRMSRIRLVCIPHHQSPEPNTDWLYMETGRKEHEIDEIVDAREYRDRIISVMRAHRSQRSDAERHILDLGDSLGMNYFKVIV